MDRGDSSCSEGLTSPSNSASNDQSDWELQHSVELYPWRSPLIYASHYITQGGSPTSTFFASKTLEAIEQVCTRGTRRGEATLVVNQIVNESEELRLARKQLDELLVAIAFIVFTFDGTAFRVMAKGLDQGFAKKVQLIRKRFIDQVPLADYLAVLNREFRKNEKTIEPLSKFFDELIKNAAAGQSFSLTQRATGLRICIKGLIEEAGRRIEKPDRIFYSAESLDIISEYAESLFDVDAEKEKFFRKYKWAYPRGKSFNNLNIFWAICMIGLFAIEQALDRHVASVQASETDKAETTALRKVFDNNNSSATVSIQKRLITTEGSISLHSRYGEHGRDWIPTCLAIAQCNLSKVIRIVTNIRAFVDREAACILLGLFVDLPPSGFAS